MSNTEGSQPVSESEADPLNSTINPRNNSGMNFPSDRAESNPNISGFIDESPYTGPGTRLQSQWEGNETNTDKIAKLLFRNFSVGQVTKIRAFFHLFTVSYLLSFKSSS